MNWLAHIFLSDNHIEYQLGNLLADLLKGKSWPDASPRFDDGLAMHSAIDRFTDQHPCVKQSKSRLGTQGRLKAVVIDITYDHLLAKNWQHYSDQPLVDFINGFHTHAQLASHHYPEPARTFLSRLIRSGHLLHYHSLLGLEEAFRRLDLRLSDRVRRKESTLAYLPLVRDQLTNIEKDFSHFMPDLIDHFKSFSGLSLDDHWLKKDYAFNPSLC